MSIGDLIKGVGTEIVRKPTRAALLAPSYVAGGAQMMTEMPALVAGQIPHYTEAGKVDPEEMYGTTDEEIDAAIDVAKNFGDYEGSVLQEIETDRNKINRDFYKKKSLSLEKAKKVLSKAQKEGESPEEIDDIKNYIDYLRYREPDPYSKIKEEGLATLKEHGGSQQFFRDVEAEAFEKATGSEFLKPKDFVDEYIDDLGKMSAQMLLMGGTGEIFKRATAAPKGTGLLGNLRSIIETPIGKAIPTANSMLATGHLVSKLTDDPIINFLAGGVAGGVTSLALGVPSTIAKTKALSQEFFQMTNEAIAGATKASEVNLAATTSIFSGLFESIEKSGYTALAKAKINLLRSLINKKGSKFLTKSFDDILKSVNEKGIIDTNLKADFFESLSENTLSYDNIVEYIKKLEDTPVEKLSTDFSLEVSQYDALKDLDPANLSPEALEYLEEAKHTKEPSPAIIELKETLLEELRDTASKMEKGGAVSREVSIKSDMGYLGKYKGKVEGFSGDAGKAIKGTVDKLLKKVFRSSSPERGYVMNLDNVLKAIRELNEIDYDYRKGNITNSQRGLLKQLRSDLYDTLSKNGDKIYGEGFTENLFTANELYKTLQSNANVTKTLSSLFGKAPEALNRLSPATIAILAPFLSKKILLGVGAVKGFDTMSTLYKMYKNPIIRGILRKETPLWGFSERVPAVSSPQLWNSILRVDKVVEKNLKQSDFSKKIIK